MKRKPVFLCGAALVLGAIGFVVADGKDVPQRGEAKQAQPAEKGDAKPDAKPAEKKSFTQSVSGDHSADEEAIRLTGETFVKAFGSGNAKALAAHYTMDAEYIDEHGNVFQGRAAIEGSLTAGLARNPGSKIEMNIESIRFVSPGVAVEDGTTKLAPAGNAEPVYSHYTAIHVKANGKWLAASVREQAPKIRRQHRAQLQQLAWLQGDWIDEGEDSAVIFSCAASDGGNFLLRKFSIHVAGEEAMSGVQRIGWDPLTGKLRTWTFDSEGGYTEGCWHRDNDRWVLKSAGVTADGQTASSTNIYTLVNEHTMTWQSVDHEIAGVELPDSPIVTIVRRAPLPEAADVGQPSKSN